MKQAGDKPVFDLGTSSRRGTGPRRLRKALGYSCLCLCLLSAMLLAAWQIHLLTTARQRAPVSVGSPGRRQGFEGLMRSLPRRPLPASVPAAPEANPLSAVGFGRLEGHPDDVPPPTGAKRLAGVLRGDDKNLQEEASYRFPGLPQKIVEHYKRVLSGVGYALSEDSHSVEGSPGGRGGDRTLVFFSGQKRAILYLRKDAKEANIVIVFTVVRPEK